MSKHNAAAQRAALRGGRRRRIVLAGLAVGLMAANAAVAKAADKVVAVFSSTTSGGYPLYVGKDKGFFADAGLDVSFVKTPTPTAAMSTLASGDADLAVYGMSAGFFNIAANSDFVLLAGVTAEQKGYVGQAFVASNEAYAKGLTSPAGLAGKRIGIGGLGAGAHYALFLLAEKYHVPFDSLTITVLNGDANIMAAAKVNGIDAGVTGAGTLAAAAEKAGDSKVIALTANEMPGMMSAVMFASRKAVNTRRDVLVRFMRAYLRGAALYADAFEKRDASGAFARTPLSDELLGIIAKNSGQPAEAVAAGLVYVPPDGSLDAGEVKTQLSVWKRLGALDPKVNDQANFVDLSILEAARKP